MIPVMACFLAFAASLLMAVVILATRRLHGRLSHDHAAGVQKLHHSPVPRIGGLAVLVGLIIGGLALPPSAGAILWLVGLAAIPAFGVGLIEDLTKRAGIRIRLLATIAAGVVFALLSGWRIDHVDLPGIDLILGLWLPSLLFTGFAIGGIANAVNIIDGVNGLASGAAIIMFIGAAIIAGMVGDHAVLAVCLIMVAAIGGFFVLNFPGGRIFLGDAGAYGIGFVIACVTVMLPARNPQLSPIIGLLLLSYPVIETMVSIRRRTARARNGNGVGDSAGTQQPAGLVGDRRGIGGLSGVLSPGCPGSSPSAPHHHPHRPGRPRVIVIGIIASSCAPASCRGVMRGAALRAGALTPGVFGAR